MIEFVLGFSLVHPYFVGALTIAAVLLVPLAVRLVRPTPRSSDFQH